MNDAPSSSTSIKVEDTDFETFPEDITTPSELDFCCRGGGDHGLSPCSPYSIQQDGDGKIAGFQVFATLYDEQERVLHATAEQAIDLGKRRGKPVQTLRLV